MLLTVLVENNTCIDDYAFGEPALAFYIEDEDKKILFDTGYSPVIINNAKHYNIDLSDLDYIILSHGHNDHTRGLAFLLNEYDLSGTTLICHPDVFNEKRADNLDIGIPLELELIKKNMDVVLTKEPLKITSNLAFLGEIPRNDYLENFKALGQENRNGQWCVDYLMDDSALIYNGEQLAIITGCSHSGICNICEYAKKLTNKKIDSIIGGFHLFDVDNQLLKTIDYFKTNEITNLYPCHCVSFHAKAKINETIPINEVMVGSKVEFR